MKMKENSAAYDKEAANLALSGVTIRQCKHCGHPTVDGYCCGHCKSSDPTDDNQEPSYIEM